VVQYSARAAARFWNYSISVVVLRPHPLIAALEAHLWLHKSNIKQHKADLCTLTDLSIHPSPLRSLIQKDWPHWPNLARILVRNSSRLSSLAFPFLSLVARRTISSFEASAIGPDGCRVRKIGCARHR